MFAQYDHYKKLNYAAPLDEPLLLAGNFAELRSNHFHGGLDIKTNSEVGHNVYSIEDGYVYRIKVSERGYGKCLYVQHPTGHRSVYAHLQKFSDKIERFVRGKQYAKQSYTIELFLSKDELKVKKSEIVAYGGNTGSSSGPHLHFEIRDNNDVTINPLLFGFNIRDEIRPNINVIGIYPREGQGLVNGKTKPLFITPFKKGQGQYSIGSKSIELSGQVGFGVSTLDYLNNSSNRCGIFSIELKVDDQTIFKHTLEKVSFQETRYINALVDYATYKKTGSKLQKCFVDDGNFLSTYSDVVNKGYFDFNDQKQHKITLILKDTYMNTSVLNFMVKSTNQTFSTSTPKSFAYNQYNSFDNKEVMVALPKYALYKDVDFYVSKDSSLKKPYYKSAVYNIHDKYVPLHKRMTLSIKDPGIDAKLRSKTYIAELDGGVYFNRTNYSNGYFSTKTKYLGKYVLVSDEKPPVITNKSFKSGANIAGAKQLVFKIADNLSGIQNYKGYIDGKWVLFEYEYKKKRLTYTVDEYFPVEKGKHEIKLQVTDKVGNVSILKQGFYL